MAGDGKHEGLLDIPWLPMGLAGLVMTASGVYGLARLGVIGLPFIAVGIGFLVWSAVALGYKDE